MLLLESASERIEDSGSSNVVIFSIIFSDFYRGFFFFFFLNLGVK